MDRSSSPFQSVDLDRNNETIEYERKLDILNVRCQGFLQSDMEEIEKSYFVNCAREERDASFSLCLLPFFLFLLPLHPSTSRRSGRRLSWVEEKERRVFWRKKMKKARPEKRRRKKKNKKERKLHQVWWARGIEKRVLLALLSNLIRKRLLSFSLSLLLSFFSRSCSLFSS